MWGRQADACWQSLTVGSRVLIEGHLRLDVREDHEVRKQRRLEVVTDRVQFVDGTAAIRAAMGPEAPIDEQVPEFFVDTPAQIIEADPPAPDE